MLPEIVIAALEKDSNRQLGNFIKQWDFSRFAYLVERLPVRDNPLPKISEIKDALIQCREVRNQNAHYSGDPDTVILNDAELVGLVQCTRKCLPTVNSKNTETRPVKPEQIYKRLRVLESMLFYKDKDVPCLSHRFANVSVSCRRGRGGLLTVVPGNITRLGCVQECQRWIFTFCHVIVGICSQNHISIITQISPSRSRHSKASN
jgi:hypothetical protein